MYGKTPATPGPGSAPPAHPSAQALMLEAVNFAVRAVGTPDGTRYAVFHVPTGVMLTPLTNNPKNPALQEHMDTAILTAAVCRKVSKR